MWQINNDGDADAGVPMHEPGRSLPVSRRTMLLRTEDE
jgi:hypothetical protein